MSLPFLRPSPPPSARFLSSFLRPSTSSRTQLPVRKRHTTAWSTKPAAYYSTATSTPSSFNSTSTTTGPPGGATAAAAAAASSPLQSSVSGTASSSSSSSLTPNPAASSTITQQQASSSSLSSSSQASFEPLPYHVHRTASQQLPVYSDKKAGGTLKQTVVRKIEGDVDALRARLADGLAGLVKPEQIKINRLNGHIVIKGHVMKEVAAVLRELNF